VTEDNFVNFVSPGTDAQLREDGMRNFLRKRVLTKGVLFAFLMLYVASGLYTQSRLLEKKPFSAFILEDFSYYENALSLASEGKSPYSNQTIGSGYLYPPPALLVVELFSHIRSLPAKFIMYTVLNGILLGLIIYGTARYYGYNPIQTWTWYLIGFSFAPFLELLYIGQINIITLFGLFVLFIFTERHWLYGGMGLAASILTKFSPILLIGFLLARMKWKVLFSTVLFMIALIGGSALKYGLDPILEYPSVIKWLSQQFIFDQNSYALVVRASLLEDLVRQDCVSRSAGFVFQHHKFLQNAVIGYFMILIGGSVVLTHVSREREKEPTFITMMIGMTLVPNILWYHHYVFLLLPVFIWMGWKKLDSKVTAWCLIWLFTIQIDRWLLAPFFGFSAHIFGHISIWYLLISQIRTADSNRFRNLVC
jgi:hypothetical protein